MNVGLHTFEDDLPAGATGDDLVQAMAAILIVEAETYLANLARFEELYGR